MSSVFSDRGTSLRATPSSTAACLSLMAEYKRYKAASRARLSATAGPRWGYDVTKGLRVSLSRDRGARQAADFVGGVVYVRREMLGAARLVPRSARDRRRCATTSCARLRLAGRTLTRVLIQTAPGIQKNGDSPQRDRPHFFVWWRRRQSHCLINQCPTVLNTWNTPKDTPRSYRLAFCPDSGRFHRFSGTRHAPNRSSASVLPIRARARRRRYCALPLLVR